IKAVSEDEIKQKICHYAIAAEKAIKAEAGGVEIPEAQGYLPDQFIHWNFKELMNPYGRRNENRCRFSLNIVDAVSTASRTAKTVIRLSPWACVQDMAAHQTKSSPTFVFIFRELQKRAGHHGQKLAFLHLVDLRI
ncbi:NADH:flavin oxidoreductase/NADH oxidase, partial [Yarrowia lipolytica]